MTAGKLHITDKKSRSTRRALLRFLKHYDYGCRDIALEISDIISREPISFINAAATIVGRLAFIGFEPVLVRDRRALRIFTQISDEYFRRSGTTAGAPFVSVLLLKALHAVAGSSEKIMLQQSHSPCLPRAPNCKVARFVRPEKNHTKYTNTRLRRARQQINYVKSPVFRIALCNFAD